MYTSLNDKLIDQSMGNFKVEKLKDLIEYVINKTVRNLRVVTEKDMEILISKELKNIDENLFLEIIEIIINLILMNEKGSYYKEQDSEKRWYEKNDYSFTELEKLKGFESFEAYRNSNTTDNAVRIIERLIVLIEKRKVSKKLEKNVMDKLQSGVILEKYYKNIRKYIKIVNLLGMSDKLIISSIKERYKQELTKYENLGKEEKSVQLYGDNIGEVVAMMNSLWQTSKLLKSENLVNFLDEEMIKFDELIDKAENKYKKLANTTKLESFKISIYKGKSPYKKYLTFIKEIEGTKELKLENRNDITLEIQIDNYLNYLKIEKGYGSSRKYIIDMFKRKMSVKEKNETIENLKIEGYKNTILFKFANTKKYNREIFEEYCKKVIRLIVEDTVWKKIDVNTLVLLENELIIKNDITNKPLKKGKVVKF